MPSICCLMELYLPDVHLIVKRDDNRLRIHMKQRKERALNLLFRVHVPPCSKIWAKLNGKPVAPSEMRHSAGINGIQLEVPGGRLSEAELTVAWRPFPVKAVPSVPARMAKDAYTYAGQQFSMSLHNPLFDVPESERFEKMGLRLGVRIMDPLAALIVENPLDSLWDIDGLICQARRRVSIDPEDYGSVGARLLSRRTVFIQCDVTAEGDLYRWLMPVDFKLFAKRRPHDAQLRLQDGRWMLTVESYDPLYDYRFRSEHVLSPAELARLTPGINVLEWRAGALGTVVQARFDTRPLFAQQDWQELARACVRHVPLPEQLLLPDGEWRNWRVWFSYGHPPWIGLVPPLQHVGESALLEPPCTPGVSFLNSGRRMLVVSRHIQRPVVTLTVSGKARKLYLLVVPLLDNHDVFAPVARVSVQCSDGAMFTRTLHLPGDLDWWAPPGIVGGFATYASEWQAPLSWETPSCVMNVVEVDLGDERGLESVTIETIGRYPALGVVGISLWGSPSPEALERRFKAGRHGVCVDWL